MNKQNNKKILFVICTIFLLILVIGGTFAYFQIVANNNATTTTISGEGELVGQASLNTNITSLKLNLTADIMSKSNIGKIYYASQTGDGIESSKVTDGNGRYTLATATLTESDVRLDCTYSYDISATTSKAITDSSDMNLKVVITETNGLKTTYSLKQLLTGVTHTANIKKLTYGADQKLGIEAYIENTTVAQNNLSGNEYTITIKPKSGNAGFSCDATQRPDYAGFYYINSSTNITNMPIIGKDYYESLIKVSEDSEIYKEDLLGGTIVFKITGNEDPQIINIDEQIIAYEDAYITVIGSFQKYDEFIFATIVHQTPPDGYGDLKWPFKNYVGAEPGVYIAYLSETLESISLLLPINNVKGDYSLTYDTDISNMTKVPHPYFSNGYLVKVSNDLPTPAELSSGILTGSIDNGTIGLLPITDNIIEINDESIFMAYQGAFVVVYNTTNSSGINFPSTGVYLIHDEFVDYINVFFPK